MSAEIAREESPNDGRDTKMSQDWMQQPAQCDRQEICYELLLLLRQRLEKRPRL
jgi:hypothetical protein